MKYKFKSLKELKDYSTISVTDDIEAVRTKLYTHNNIEIYLPLHEFVIKVHENGLIVFYYLIDNGDSWTIELSGMNDKYVFRNLIALKAVMKNNKLEFKVIAYEDINFKKNVKIITENFKILLGCIILAKDFPDVVMRKKYKKKAKNIEPSKNQTPEKKTHIVKLGEKVIYTIDSVNEEDYKPFKKSYDRHTESWEVMGHDRHYKNGKVVHIESYPKGKGKISKKDYRI